MRSNARCLVVLASLTALAGCNSGIAALTGSSDSGNTPAVPSSVSDVTVRDSVNSPAEIAFTLAAQTGDTVHIEYRMPPGVSGGTNDYLPIATLGADEVNFSSSGEANQFDWAFAGDLGTEFVGGLVVRVRLNNGASATTAEPINVGNSPPVISPFSFPASEVVGVVGMLFTVADTNDTVSLGVEVNVDAENGFPEGSWETALPDLGQVLVPFMAAESGTTVPFHWDVVGQYGPLDSEVMVRATAVDTADPGEQPLEHQVESSSLLRVDNNAPPEVTVDNLSFALSEDGRRGIVVPYTVSDAEGDTLDLVFQWTREDEPFVDLPDDEALLEAILGDPIQREQFRIATPYRMPGGLAKATDEADTVELPELGSTQSHLLQSAEQPGGDLSGALDGYELELLRTSKIPEALASTWSANPLDGPVAGLPGSDTTTAFVLDRAGAMWRAREIDLATGAVVQVLASGNGTPDAMTLERGGGALLIAAHEGSLLRVDRVDLESLEVRTLVDGPGPIPGDAIRAMASLGTHVVLATSGDALLRLDYADATTTRISTVVDGLATPWGLALDPVSMNSIYLAERDGGTSGRILSVALDTGAVHTLPVSPPGVPHPESLALEQRSGRLLVLTDEVPANGSKELRAFEPGSAQVSVLTAELPESATGLVIGADEMRLLVLPSADDLAASGGVVHRRTIVAYDPTRRVVTVECAFVPPLSSGSSVLSWQVRSPARLQVEGGLPRSAAFVWDSRDLPGGQGLALLKLTARDADAASVEHEGGKPILSGLAGDVLSLGGPETTLGSFAVATGDLDGDGDLDLVSANFESSTLAVFFQMKPGVFDPVPQSLGGSATNEGVYDVATADLDGDGDLDLVSANLESSTLTVFFQTAAGVFDTMPSLTLGGPETTGSIFSVAAADLDGDGDVDIACTNGPDEDMAVLSVFFQTGAGVFDPEPSLTLGGSGMTDGAADVIAADLDGDGDTDLVSANSGTNSQTPDGSLTVFFQTAAGVFDTVPSLTLTVPEASATPRFFAAADLDGDGDLDLASANFGSGSITMYFQTAAGVFDIEPSLTLGNSTTAGVVSSVAVADMDGDGDVDIVSTSFASDSLSVFFQTAPGVFDPEPLFLGESGTTDGPSLVLAEDLDGDGDADLVSANQFSNNLAMFFQTGAGDFAPEPDQTFGAVFATGFPASVVTADMDGDGDVDIVSANSGVALIVDSVVTVFFQKSPGIFDSDPQILGSSATIEGAASVAAADLDGDGDVDIVTANGIDLDVGFLSAEGTDTLTVFLQTEPGVFDIEPSLTLGGPLTTDGAVDVAAADLDGDGDADLVSANQVSGTLTVFFQDRAGLFDAVPSLTLGGPGATAGAADLVVADLDGDGDLDLASANGFDIIVPPDPDDPDDLGSVVEGSDTLTVFFQTAPGVFDLAPSLTLGGPGLTDGAISVAAADMDGDGDLDLVSANALGSTLTVFYQTEAGVFDRVPSLTLDNPMANGSAQSVKAADLDGDGDTDLVLANPGGGTPTEEGINTVTVLLQTRAGVFEPATLSLSGAPTVFTLLKADAAVADMDGDGDVDILSANGSSGNLTVFYNAHQP